MTDEEAFRVLWDVGESNVPPELAEKAVRFRLRLEGAERRIAELERELVRVEGERLVEQEEADRAHYRLLQSMTEDHPRRNRSRQEVEEAMRNFDLWDDGIGTRRDR